MFLSCTFCYCRPVLNPGSLTKDILIPNLKVKNRKKSYKSMNTPNITRRKNNNLRLTLFIFENISRCSHHKEGFAHSQI